MTARSSNRRLTSALGALALGLAASSVHASEIAYISSSGGFMLHESGGQAVTASWQGQAPLQSFTGYGAVRQRGKCLTGRGPGGQPLTWEPCRAGDRNQTWQFSPSKFVNEAGWCADVEGNRGGAGVRVIAWQCSGASNQRWKAHMAESANAVAARMSDPRAAALLRENVARAPVGSAIDLRTGQLLNIGVGGLRSAPAGQVGVTAGGGKLIAAGGLN